MRSGCRRPDNKAKRYADFRKMLEAEKGIDGVIVATPGSHPRDRREDGDGGWARPSTSRSR
jgi:hypothetical protein